jgi:hypothetical protein
MPLDTGTIPERLKDAVRTGALVPFVGAGLSKQAVTADKKAFPTWRELLDELRMNALKHKYISSSEGKQLGRLLAEGRFLMAAQALRAEMPQDALEQIIVDRFSPPDAKPGEVHRWLFKLQSDIVITTNYDKLLEDAFATSVQEGPLRLYIQERTRSSKGSAELPSGN